MKPIHLLQALATLPIMLQGPGESVDMKRSPKNWMAADFDDSKWPGAAMLDHGKPKGMADAFGWMLVPSSLPQMERTPSAYPGVTQSGRRSSPPFISGL